MLWRVERITIRVDEGGIRAAGIYAAERGTTVDTLVSEVLTGVANRERILAARRRIRELSERSAVRIGARAWTREELHTR